MVRLMGHPNRYEYDKMRRCAPAGGAREDDIVRLNWSLSGRLLGTTAVLVAVAACSSPSTPPTPAQLASQSAAVSREAAAAQAELNSAVYGTSAPPKTTTATTMDVTTAGPSMTGEYTRTWTKDYAKTTCTEFRTVMTGQQAFVAAADMLVNARVGTDSSLPFPSDDLINMFENDVLTGCDTDASASDNIVDIASAILVIDNKQHYLK